MALFSKITAGIKKGPKPATITIEIEYEEDKFGFLKGMQGFKMVPNNAPIWTKVFDSIVSHTWKPLTENVTSDTQFISFQIPVMPPTIEMDFGNSKDSQNVTRIGEVVLPKYKKATQFRWESFFPYDSSAPYLQNSGGIINSLAKIESSVTRIIDNFSQLLGNESRIPTPELYIKIFKLLSNTQKPFSIAVTFYEGGDIESTWVTLDSFGSKPENNGDYSYNISLIEWVDISPTRVDATGKPITITKSPLPKTDINKFGQFLNTWTKISNLLSSVISLYANLKSVFLFTFPLFIMNLRDTLTCPTRKIGVSANMFNRTKITTKDIKLVSQSLQKLSFKNSSNHLYDIINNYKSR